MDKVKVFETLQQNLQGFRNVTRIPKEWVKVIISKKVIVIKNFTELTCFKTIYTNTDGTKVIILYDKHNFGYKPFGLLAKLGFTFKQEKSFLKKSK